MSVLLGAIAVALFSSMLITSVVAPLIAAAVADGRTDPSSTA